MHWTKGQRQEESKIFFFSPSVITRSNTSTTLKMNLSPELLDNIFHKLNSKELVLFRRVCSLWSETINRSSSLRKVLDLPEDSIRFWRNSILSQFSEKWGHKIEKVSFPRQASINYANSKGVVEVLSKSSQTLSSVSCNMIATSQLEPLLSSELFPRLSMLFLSSSQDKLLRGVPKTTQHSSVSVSLSDPHYQVFSSKLLRHLKHLYVTEGCYT